MSVSWGEESRVSRYSADLRDRGVPVDSSYRYPTLQNFLDSQIQLVCLYTQRIQYIFLFHKLFSFHNGRLTIQPRRAHLRQWLKSTSSHRRMRVWQAP